MSYSIIKKGGFSTSYKVQLKCSGAQLKFLLNNDPITNAELTNHLIDPAKKARYESSPANASLSIQ